MDESNFRLFNVYLKITEIFISLILPVILIIFGFYLNKLLKSLENKLSARQTLLEKKIDVFNLLSSDVNKIFSFCYRVGAWRDLAPDQVLLAKRSSDAIFFQNLPYWDSNVVLTYKRFMEGCFDTYRGVGLSAVLGGDVEDYKEAYGAAWDDAWQRYFIESSRRTVWLNTLHGSTGKSYAGDTVLPRYIDFVVAVSQSMGVSLDARSLNYAIQKVSPK